VESENKVVKLHKSELQPGVYITMALKNLGNKFCHFLFALH